MNVFLYLVNKGAPDFTPIIMATPFWFGTEADGRRAFKSLLDIGRYNDTTAGRPYPQWNSGTDRVYVKGRRKPSSTVGFSHMVPRTWRLILNEYAAFVK